MLERRFITKTHSHCLQCGFYFETGSLWELILQPMRALNLDPLSLLAHGGLNLMAILPSASAALVLGIFSTKPNCRHSYLQMCPMDML